jgi:hypothetical protein
MKVTTATHPRRLILRVEPVDLAPPEGDEAGLRLSRAVEDLRRLAYMVIGGPNSIYLENAPQVVVITAGEPAPEQPLVLAQWAALSKCPVHSLHVKR